MSEFINYKVELTLNDGGKSSGFISNVNGRQITLFDVLQSSTPGQRIPSLSVSNTHIADLKVLQVPQDLLNSNPKNRNLSKNASNQPDKVTVQPALLDDAIIFAKPSSSSAKGSSNASLKGLSRTATPRGAKMETKGLTIGLEQEGTIQDIKTSSDFDFAANLAMFDKKSVFEDFEKNDVVDPASRLVSHNKLDTRTRKNGKYSNDEMVLEVNKEDNWDSIDQNTSTATRSVSKALNPTNFEENLQVLRQRLTSPQRDFRFVDSQTSLQIPVCSPVQLLEIERLASDTFGILPDILDEICALSTAPLITNNILGGSSRLSNKKNHNLPPLVVLLVGSIRCGNRAFTIGRHLCNHGIRVLAYVTNNEDYSVETSQKWRLFIQSGGKVITSNFSYMLKTLDELDTPPELVIDALQGYDEHLEDIYYREDDMKELLDIMVWCNSFLTTSKIMALDIPSGIDGGSGTVSDPNLKINCKWCVSMGLPISGILHAYKNSYMGIQDDIIHYLVDIGIPNKVYSRKGNFRKFENLWFSADNSIKMIVSNN